MSLVRVSGALGYVDKFAGTSPYAGAYRGAKLGKKYGDWVVRMGKRSSNRRSYSSEFGGVAGAVGSAPTRYGSAPARIIGSAPENALRVLGDMPSSGVRRRKTSKIYK